MISCFEREGKKGEKVGIIGIGLFGSRVTDLIKSNDKSDNKYDEKDLSSLSESMDQESVIERVSDWDMAMIACDQKTPEAVEATIRILKACRSKRILTAVFAKEDRKRKESQDDIRKYADTVFFQDDMEPENCEGYICALADIPLNLGMVNVDMDDLREILLNKGDGHIGMAKATGEDKAIKAVEKAVTVKGASNYLLVVFGEFGLIEMTDATEYINNCTGGEANIVIGCYPVNYPDDEIKIVAVATGM